MNIIPFTCKEYKQGKFGAVENRAAPYRFLSKDLRAQIADKHNTWRGFFAAHQAGLELAFGKPSFHFRGEFLFKGWCFQLKGGKLCVLSSRKKGTCYEVESGVSDRAILAFLRALRTILNA